MNQILDKKNAFINNINIEFGNEFFDIYYEENIEKKQKYKQYKVQFIIFAVISLLLCFIFLYNILKSNSKEKISQKLLNNYNLTSVYQDGTSSNTNSTDSPFVIGIIKIDKINLNYPILSNTSEELLKISVCKFSGPMPNENGNLCIAGHNYINDQFFSKLNLLEIDDIVQIYDLSGSSTDYQIYKKYEVDANDLSCTNQANYKNSRIVTLITCNNISGTKRLIIQAKEKQKI